MASWQIWRNGVDVGRESLVARVVFEKTIDLLEEKLSALTLADREAMTRAEFDALAQRQNDERQANRRQMSASMIFAVMAVIGMIVNVARSSG